MLATASDDGTARIWDIGSGTSPAPLEGHSYAVNGVAFSPDGTLLATASTDGTARIWDVATGTTCATLQGHSEVVNSVAFSPDGTLLATASDDGTARIWDIATGIYQVVLIGLADDGYAAAGRDGYKLVGDPANRFWWAMKLCRFAPGELDPYVPSIRRLAAEDVMVGLSTQSPVK